MSAVNSLHLQRFPDPPSPLPRPCDHGVHLGEHSRCQRRAAYDAVHADGAADQELEEGVLHEMPHFAERYDSNAVLSPDEMARE